VISELVCYLFFAVPNPFAPTVAAPQPVVGMQSHFMPMSTTGSYGFYGQPQAAASSQPAQVAMFGAQPQMQPSVQNGSTTGMFGAAQFSMQNGMSISASAPAYMRPSSAPQAVPTQQPVAFGAWSQPTPVANPFLVCCLCYCLLKIMILSSFASMLNLNVW
jgi:hypothetical protein